MNGTSGFFHCAYYSDATREELPSPPARLSAELTAAITRFADAGLHFWDVVPPVHDALSRLAVKVRFTLNALRHRGHDQGIGARGDREMVSGVLAANPAARAV